MSNLRGKIFIDRSVQGALAMRITLHWCVFFLLASISLVGLEFFMGDPNLTFEGRLATVWNKYALFFVLMLAMVPSFIYDTVKLSHRFAGPILRLKASLRKLAEGKLAEKMVFRDGDFWMEIATDFNQVSERINTLEDQSLTDGDDSIVLGEEETQEAVGYSR